MLADHNASGHLIDAVAEVSILVRDVVAGLVRGHGAVAGLQLGQEGAAAAVPGRRRVAVTPARAEEDEKSN